MIAGRFTIPPEHPCLPGHFPGGPVVPGVVLLDEVLALLGPARSMPSVKFLRPVLPGEAVEVASDGQGGFVCTVGGAVAVQGRIA